MSRILGFVRTGRLGTLLAILGLALAVRVASVFVIDYVPIYDAVDYDLHAQSIGRGDGFPADPLVFSSQGPTAYRPPAYPYFLAAVYKLTGGEVRIARLVQALVGTITVALIGLVAWQIWNRRRGLAAAALAAIYPPLIIIGNAVIAEALFLMLEVAALAAMLRYRSVRATRWLVVAGACAGLGVLARPNGLVLLPVLFLAAMPAGWNWSWRALRGPATVVAVALLTIAPWTVRNAIVMDAFVPLTTQVGYTAHGVYNQVSAEDRSHPGAWRPTTSYPRYRRLYDPRQTEVEIDRRLRSAARDYAEAHPLYVLEAGASNTARMLELTGLYWSRRSAVGIGFSPRVGEVGAISFWVVSLLALGGALTAAARRIPLWFWLAPVLLLSSVVFIDTEVRFRLPIDPFLVVLAALAVAAGWERLAAPRMRRART